jgi:hypothetical protein
LDQGGHQNHAPSEHPDHTGEQLREVERERPHHVNQRQLENDKEDATRGEIFRESSPADLGAMQVRGRASEEDERRRTKMRDPSCEEDARGWSTCWNAGIHAHVIDRHEDHDGAADHVERCEPVGRRRCRHGKLL